MSPNLMTWHKLLPQCEEGSRNAWQAFLSRYAPIAYQLLKVYFPGRDAEGRKRLWQDTVRALAANQFERLRSFDHQAEREFLMDLRAFLFDLGRATLDPTKDAAAAPPLTLDSLEGLLQGLPLVHQEIVFLKLAGYSDRTLEKILGVPPSLAHKALERLEAEYGVMLHRGEDSCLWPAAWQQLLSQLRARQNEECPPRRLLVRVLDGQTTWYDKSPAEERMTRCRHCLELWIALREVNHWRRETHPLPPEQIDELLSVLPLAAPGSRKLSLLKRLFES